MLQEAPLFWEQHPALAAGISALLGAFAFFEGCWWICALWIFYQLFLSLPRGSLQAVLLALFALYPVLLFTLRPPLEKETTAFFSIHSVEKLSTGFQPGWTYRGTLRACGNWAGQFPCTVHCRAEAPPVANCDYLIQGSLRQTGEFDYEILPKRWQRVPWSYSLAHLRFLAKERVSTTLTKHLHPDSATFLTALFTGQLQDPMLRFTFSRLGLQHILAISGFHFAIVAAFAAFILRFFLPLRIRLWTLLGIATIYFLFIGNSPSVFRSYLACLLTLVGQLLSRKSSALNLLGGCLFLELLLDPLAIHSLGFQLSFLACFGLLFVAPLLKPHLPLRSLSEAFHLTKSEQCICVISSFFSQGLLLTLAVNCALLPVLLFHFHRFPLLSLFYNLFVPQMAALCLLLLLPALLLSALFPLASLPLFGCLNWFTQELLDLLSAPLTALDFSLLASLPGWAAALWIAGILSIGVEGRKFLNS